MESIKLLKTAIKQLQNGERTCIGCVVRQVEKDLNNAVEALEVIALDYAEGSNTTPEQELKHSKSVAKITLRGIKGK